VSGREPVEQFPRAPARVRPAGREDQLADLARDSVRAGVRRVAPIRQAWPALRLKAREPLIAGFRLIP
jgi:hypothetical protein